MVGMAADPATGGYWTVASDGGVFSFDAPFFGSMGAVKLNKPVVAMVATPDGGGYWLFASDGGVFAFGDAGFFGSLGNKVLAAPIVSAAPADAGGYWMLGADGGVFAFGDAGYFGSLGGHALVHPLAGIAAADPGGYWMTDTNGAVTAFGDAGYFGSAPQHITAPVVGIVDGPGTGVAANGAYPSGTYGYDVSRFQDNPPTCNAPLPSGHTVGIVEVTGQSNGASNPCLAHEAQWAGGGLNLYIFMTYGTDTTDQPGCNGDPACNWGYEAGVYAFEYAQAQGVNPFVTWWLDVEAANWSSNTAENDQVILGAIDALRGVGINNVGIYTSPLTWNGIAGELPARRPAVDRLVHRRPPGQLRQRRLLRGAERGPPAHRRRVGHPVHQPGQRPEPRRRLRLLTRSACRPGPPSNAAHAGPVSRPGPAGGRRRCSAPGASRRPPLPLGERRVLGGQSEASPPRRHRQEGRAASTR